MKTRVISSASQAFTPDALRRMPRWMLVLLLGTLLSCASTSDPPVSQCPQPRFTGKAPAAIYNVTSPLVPGAGDLAAGRELYEGGADPSCHLCHGIEGDGQGPMAEGFEPPPRNFACAKTVNGIPDGQLFWIIRNGSPGTAMPGFKQLRNEQVWQLVMYLRQLAQ
ncbi:MAG: c-type cytochrome [Gammaproteobacteria bacterium]|nr:c-type cytochrome [Gammaproteobacteria bacterium]